jgi:hypothetical protein
VCVCVCVCNSEDGSAMAVVSSRTAPANEEGDASSAFEE